MNKVFMTKRRNDGKIVVCSELTRARGKMKSVVTAVAAATLSVGVAGEAMATEFSIIKGADNADPVSTTLTPMSNLDGTYTNGDYIDWVFANNMDTLMSGNASNTLRLYTSCTDGEANDVDGENCTGMSYLVFQDTDNTTTVSTNASKSFLTVTKGAAKKHTLDQSQGIGSNTDYQLDFNYDDRIFNVTDNKFSLKLNGTTSPLKITNDGLTFNYNTTTLGLDTDGKLTALPSTVTLPKVYFHANDNTTTQGAGDPNTNLGELTDKAGATGKFSVTAGVNATATNTSSVAIGHSVTSKGYGSITIGDSSTSSNTKVEWVASNGTVEKTFTSSGVFYTKITTTKNGNEVNVTREVYKNVDKSRITKDTTGKITNIDVTGLTPETFANANSTTSTGATGAGSIAMGADTINTTSAISKLALVNRAPITSRNANKTSDKLISNSNYGEIVTLPKGAAPSVQAPTASGDAAIAIGAKTTAQGDGSIALGALATALPENSIAIGTGAITRSFLDPYSKGLQAVQSIAIGYLATSENQGSVSLGTTAKALHDQALALGAATYASGFNSAAIGNNNKATGYGAFVIGGDDAGKKDVASNKIEGANTEYASLFYNPVLGEVVANAYASVNSTAQTITGITGKPNVYTVRAVDITEAKTDPVETKYVINGTFDATEKQKFKNITNKTLTASALTDAEVATLTAQGYTVLNKADFTVEELALKIYDPLGYVSGMVAQYKAQGKTDAEIETLKTELYKQTIAYNTTEVYSPYQVATSSGVGSIAFGLKTQATQDGAIAMGVASNAHAKESIAVGVGTVTTGERAVSVGSRSIASGERSIAIGTYSEAPDAKQGETRYDSPRALADDAVAIGTGAYVGLDVQGTKSVALGSGSIVTTGHGDIKENLTTGAWEGILRNYKSYDPNKEPGVNNATLGETHKQFDLGNTTTGGTTGTINKAYVGRIIYQNFAGQTAVGAVSVGYGDNEKRIQNVAAGEISPTSTDAINGSQLYMVAYELGKEVESSYFHVNRADDTQQVGDTNTNKGKLDDYAGARSNYAVTAGVNTRAVGNGSISMGHDALSGMTTAQYTAMAAIDSVLQSNITKKETAENQIIAAEKTLKYVTEQRAKLQDAINLYNIDIEAVKTTIKNTTNADELARLNAQLNKMIASRDLLQGQLPELAAMETNATTTKTAALTDKADAETVVTAKQQELADYLTANKKDYALAIGSQAIASGEKSIAIGKDNNITTAGTNSVALGSTNHVNSANTYVLGSGVGVKDDGSLLSTVANSVYLGNDSTIKDSNVEITQTNAGSVKNFTKDGAEGTTSTAGANGNVTTSNVANIVYGAFAGAVANGAVTVGSAGAERRIMNVAAGEISASSTDAINGSQLYFVAKQAATPFTVKANTLNDTDALMLDKQYAAADGKQVQLGQEFSILGAQTSKGLTRNQDAATDGTYSAKNIQTIVDDNGVQIQMAEKPEFKELTVKAGDNDSNPVKITSGAGDTGGTISNLSTTLPDNSAQTAGTKPTSPTTTNAATLGDVLNAGWNLKENNTAKDFVTAYDTVDFVNGEGTTVNITSANGVSTVKVNVNTTTLSNTPPAGGTADGKVYAPTGEEGKKLVNATTVADAINQAAWNTVAAKTGTGTVDGTATSAAINAGDKVNFVAGNNLVIKQENQADGTETNFTYSLASDLKGINSISNNAANGDNVTTITLSNDPTDKKVTLNDAKLTGVKDGEIADNSKDAINGSQLKDLADKTGLTVNNAKDGFDTPTFTNLKNVDGSTITAPTTIKGAIDKTIDVVNKGLQFGADNNKANPTTQQLGSALTVESGDVTENNIDYKGDNLVTHYSNTDGNGKIVIGLSEKPVFKEVTAKDGDKVSKLSPTNITTTDGTSTTTIAPNSITVGDKAGDTDKPVTITSGQNGGTISNLDGNLAGAKSGTTAPTDSATKPTLTESNAATVGDVLNAGWNLKENNTAKDFVTAYDTVDFVNGNGTTVNITSTNGVSKVKVDVNTTALSNTSTVGGTADGKIYAPAGDEGKLVNATTVANAINQAAWNTVAKSTGTGKVEGTATSAAINAGDKVNFVAGNNLVIKQENKQDGTETDFTYSLASDLKGINSISNNAANGDNATTITLSNDPTDKKVTLNDAKLTGVKDGEIADNSSDAINGSQLKDLADKTGLTVNSTTNTGFDTPTFTNLKNVDGTNITTAPTTIKGAIDKTIDVVNKGLQFGADNNKDTPTTQQLGSALTVESGDVTDTTNNVAYKGDNLVTNYTKDANGNGKIVIGLSEKPEFKEVTAKDGNNVSKLSPTNITTTDGTSTTTIAPNSITVGDKAGTDDKPVTITSGQNGGTISNLDGNLAGAKANTNAPTTEASKPNNLANNNAATVGDVLNAGWNLQGNGVAKDFVRAYDTVNFINGDGTTVEVKTEADGKLSTIKVNTAMRYTDSAGNPLVKNDADGKFYPPTADGKPDTTQTGVDAGDVQISTINPDGTSTTATKLGNVAQGAGTLDGTVDANGQPLVKVGNQYYTPDQFVNGKLKNDAQPTTPAGTTNAAYNGLADLNSANPTNVMTVADAKNLGWVVSASGNGYADDVRNANEVKFFGKDGITVEGKTNGNTREITIALEKGEVVKSNEWIVTQADGTQVEAIKIGNDYYAKGDIDPETGEPKAGTNPITVKNDANGQPLVENKGAGYVNGNQVADAIQKSGFVVGKQADTSAITFDNQDEKVNPNDNLKFADGKGTVASLGTVQQLDSEGNVVTTTVVKFDIDSGLITPQTDGSVKGPSSKTADEIKGLNKDLADAQKALADAQKALADLPTTASEAEKAAAAQAVKIAQNNVKAAETAINDAGLNKVATAQDVANAINESGWNVIAEANGGVVSGSNKELVKPSETVSLKAGKNIEIAQEGQNFTFRTSANPEFNSVTVGEPAYQKADGTPVNKVGDKYYTADGQEVAAGDVVKATKPAVNMTAEAAKPATNNGNNPPSTALNITSADGNPTQMTGVGSVLNTATVATNPDANSTTAAVNDKLVNLGTKDAPLTENQLNSAATVRDIANMGWIVSASGNAYTDTVKNANQVDFKGTGLATVKGETNATTGIRTITVDVNAQNTVESAQTPVVYTDANGNKVTKADDGNFYPADSVVIDGKRYPKGSVKNAAGDIVDANGQAVAELQPIAKGDIIASMNNGDNATKPTALSNVGSNLTPTTSGDTLINQDGTTTTGQTPTKVAKAPTNAAKMNNNAATVGDVLNAGWNLQGNGSAVDFVKPYDTVNFVDGVGTLVKASSDGATSVIQVDVDKGSINVNTTTGAVTPTDLTTYDTAIKNAQDALDAAKAANPTDPNAQAIKDAEAALAQAEANKAKVLNKVATVEDVANAISNSGFTLKSSAVDSGKKVSGDDELINPSDTVEMVAGKNMTVKQDAKGKITYATADDVSFNSVTIGSDVVYKDADGNELVKVGDDYYKKSDYDNAAVGADGKKDLTNVAKATMDKAKSKSEAPVKLAQDKGVGTSHTDKDGVKTDKDAPSALSVKDSLGENSQINGIASALDTKDVATKPNGTAAKDTLVDLTAPTDPDAKAKWSSSAVTVGDIANMGWIVSASGNAYTDTVKNANQVDFVGTGLATVKGETNATTGIRTITVDVNAQNTVEAADTPVIYTDTNGNKLTKVGDNFYKVDDVTVINGKAYPKGSVEIDGKVYPAGSVKDPVTGKVMKDGQEVAEQTASTPVNSSDVIASMNDGDNVANNPKTLANVKGTLSDTSSIKADGVDKKGNPVVKGADGKYYPFGTEMDPATGNPKDSTIAAINDVTAAPIKITNAAPITAEEAAKLANNAKNHAATVGDVLNAGWNLQGNGSAVDFVKPYDTVNFVDGVGTTVVATSDGATSVIKVNTVMQYTDADGNPLIKINGKYYPEGSVVAADGSVYPKGTQLDQNGNVVGDVTIVKPTAPQISLVNPYGTSTTPTQLGNVAQGTKTLSNPVDNKGKQLVKVGDKYYPAGTELNEDGTALKDPNTKPLVKVDGKLYPADTELNDDGSLKYPDRAQSVAAVPTTGTSDAYNGLADLNGSNPTNAMTVADAKNLGWVVSTEDGYADDVRNANEVKFVGKDGISVTGKTDGNVREITIALEKGEVIKSNEGKVDVTKPDGTTSTIDVIKIVETDENGNPETDENGNPVIKYYDKKDIDPMTGKPKDGATALGDNVVGENGKNVVNNGNKFVDGNTVAQAIQESGFVVGKQEDITGINFNNKDEKVNPNDELRFADGKGTKVSTGTVKTVDPNGEVSTKTVVKVDVDTGVITNNANGSLKGVVSAADAKKLNDDLAKAEAALAAVEKLGDSAPQNVKDAAKAAVYDAEKAIEKAGLNKVATVQNVAEAINNSGWNAKVAKTDSGEADDKGGDALVNPGDTVTMTAGDNMKITKEGLNYTIETKKDVKFDSVTANSVNIGPVTLTGSTVTNPDGSATNELSVGTADAPTRITNVAPGVNDTDAVNVSQLKGVQNNINQRFGDVYQKMDREHKNLRAGIAGAAALAGIPEVHVAGRSMIAASASAYKSENAIAVGYSRLSDNSKIKLKLTGSANTRGDVMGTVGVGYMW